MFLMMTKWRSIEILTIFTFTVAELWFLGDLKLAFNVFFVLQLMKYSTSVFQICTPMLFKYKL